MMIHVIQNVTQHVCTICCRCSRVRFSTDFDPWQHSQPVFPIWSQTMSGPIYLHHAFIACTKWCFYDLRSRIASNTKPYHVDTKRHANATNRVYGQSTSEKTVYYCENPREIYLAYDIASHTCNSSCAAIVLRAWRACLQNWKHL